MFNFKTKIMKKNTKTLIFAIVIMMFVFTGCEKDIREKYVGDWEFVEEYSWYVGPEGGEDTTYYLGKITFGSKDNTLNIHYNENLLLTMEVDKSGKLFKSYKDIHEYAKGQFEGNDKVHIEKGYKALGGGHTRKIDGTRKKGGGNE